MILGLIFLFALIACVLSAIVFGAERKVTEIVWTLSFSTVVITMIVIEIYEHLHD